MKKILTVMLAGLCTASVIAAPRVETIAPQPDDSGMLGAFVRRTYAVDKFNAIRAYEGIRVVYTPGAKHASVSAQVDPQVADSFKLAVEDGALVVRFAGNVVDCHPGDVPRAIVYVEGPAVSQVDLRNWSAVEVTASLKVSELQVGVGNRCRFDLPDFKGDELRLAVGNMGQADLGKVRGGSLTVNAGNMATVSVAEDVDCDDVELLAGNMATVRVDGVLEAEKARLVAGNRARVQLNELEAGRADGHVGNHAELTVKRTKSDNLNVTRSGNGMLNWGERF